MTPLSAAEVARRRRIAAREDGASPKRRRFTFDFGPATVRTLDSVAKSLGGSSWLEAARFAIHLAARVMQEAARGGRLVVRRPDGREVELLVPLPLGPESK